MAVDEKLVLIANPGSASRKYALYGGGHMRGSLHFEHETGRIICTVTTRDESRTVDTDLQNIAGAMGLVEPLLRECGALHTGERIPRIGLRIVAPSGYFLHDHVIDDDVVARLEAVRVRAPLHIGATLQELQELRERFAEAEIVGVSDSAFHITKPDYAWNYGIPIRDADRLDIKRFGYHGLSVASVVRQLHSFGKLPPKLIVAHLGSGASVTALWHGKSRDTTMGFSPLEGLVMATRSGSVDITAAQALKAELRLDDAALDIYLNTHSGLLGLSGSSSDIRELLDREAAGDHYAELALSTYVYNVQKAIGQMAAALGGADMLVFTGTVGERSSIIRERVTRPLHFLDFSLAPKANEVSVSPAQPVCISRLAYAKPAFVVPADESAEMARHLE